MAEFNVPALLYRMRAEIKKMPGGRSAQALRSLLDELQAQLVIEDEHIVPHNGEADLFDELSGGDEEE